MEETSEEGVILRTEIIPTASNSTSGEAVGAVRTISYAAALSADTNVVAGTGIGIGTRIEPTTNVNVSTGLSGSNSQAQLPKRAVPNVNTPERIVLCVDICESEKDPPFRSTHHSPPFVTPSISSLPQLQMLKRIANFFLCHKQSINADSEFALVILKASEPIWLQNFTKDIEMIMHILNHMQSEICNVKEFNMCTLFDLMHKHIDFPPVMADYKLVPPPNVVRLLLMYGRSDCVPVFARENEVFNLLKKHPYFTADVLFAHEENCAGFKCKDVYDSLQTLDNGYSYIFEVGKSTEAIHECSAKLLAHPLQRPQQCDAFYTFTK